MKKTLLAGFGLGVLALAYAAKDPVIMTVNGVDVPKSEFEYLYNKNSQQQINPQTLDEYVEMFKLYKMKVADAKAEGLDTLSSFIKETEQYRRDLAAPYLADSVLLNKYVEEAYDRSKQEAEAIHIMLFKTRDASQNKLLKARMDSIRDAALAGADFSELARKHSADRSSASKGGRMGYIVANNFPYAFDKVVFSLPEGQISEIVESPMGYHLIKGGKKRPARGKVQAAHILKMAREEAASPAAKAAIDSIYEVVKANPARFAEVATSESDDRGSARQGGMLPLFGAGEMVEVFDSVAFSLKDGEISKPFKSDFGWHIIHRVGSKPAANHEAVRNQVLSQVKNEQDPRYKEIQRNQTDRLGKKLKGRLNQKTMAALSTDVEANGIDSLFIKRWNSANNSKMEFASVAGKSIPVSKLISRLSRVNVSDPLVAATILKDASDGLYSDELLEAEQVAMLKEVPEYANLLKEYIDGSLLYEVSVRKVWDKASKDTEGLRRFFEDHREDYTWNEPHVKGFLVQAVNDSVGALIRERAAQLSADSIVPVIRKEFSRQCGIDKVLVAKGANAMVDNLIFGGPVVEPSRSTYKVYFMIDPRILTAPEEVADVRGLVTSDYQNEFQSRWESELRRKYPVTVNQKVLRTVKELPRAKK